LAKNLTLRVRKHRESGSMDADSISDVKAKSHLGQSSLDISTGPRRKKSVLVDALVDLPKFQRRVDSTELPSQSNVNSLIDQPTFHTEENSAPGTPNIPGMLLISSKKRNF